MWRKVIFIKVANFCFKVIISKIFISLSFTAPRAINGNWRLDSVTIVLPHLPIDSDLTDIYLNENLGDYIFKETAKSYPAAGWWEEMVLDG